MKAHSNLLFGLLLLIGLMLLTPLLTGCQKAEEKSDPNYYSGTDFKGKAAASGSGTNKPKDN